MLEKDCGLQSLQDKLTDSEVKASKTLELISQASTAGGVHHVKHNVVHTDT